MKIHKPIAVILSVLLAVLAAQAGTLRFGSAFTDEMVLQRESEAPIWGEAAPGARVKVVTSWNGRTHTCTADGNGHWQVKVTTPPAGGPYALSVSSGSRKEVLRNVYAGEVWIASGQSNMSMPLKGYYNQPVEGSTEEILSSGKRNIRFLNVPCEPSTRSRERFEGAKWGKAGPENAGECTAVGWFFARCLQESLDIPVGIINVSYGGSNVEAWMPDEACAEFSDIPVPDVDAEIDMSGGNIATTLFKGMMQPIVGFRAKGFLWYQGESSIFNVPRFAPATASMVRHWRRLWGEEDMPFYFVQIAPYDYTEWNFFTPQWPEISAYQRDAQRRCLDLIPNSGMAVTLDIGERGCIHPRAKEEVGRRLALIALHRNYGFSGFEAESPEFDRMEVQDGKAILYFRKGFNGLTSFGKELTLFEISGWNRVFVRADAYIDEGNGTVVVSSRYVDQPEAVRYAFKDYLVGELYGTGGLPVGTFRTDDWE